MLQTHRQGGWVSWAGRSLPHVERAVRTRTEPLASIQRREVGQTIDFRGLSFANQGKANPGLTPSFRRSLPETGWRGGGGVLPLDRRARLLHPLQFARLSPQRGLRRRSAARGLRRQLRIAGELVYAPLHA